MAAAPMPIEIPPQWARPPAVVIAAAKDPGAYFAFRWVTKPNVKGDMVTVSEQAADWAAVDPLDGWILTKRTMFKPTDA